MGFFNDIDMNNANQEIMEVENFEAENENDEPYFDFNCMNPEEGVVDEELTEENIENDIAEKEKIKKPTPKKEKTQSGIFGTLNGEDISLENVKVFGDIKSDGFVNIGNNVVVIGDISAQGVVISGAVKGNVDAKGHVFLVSGAIVKGDIRSKSVEIENGAIIEGVCSQCYAGINPESFFKDIK